MIKAVIVEDEKKSAELLAQLIRKNCPDIEILGKAENVKEGIDIVNKLRPELIFLDVMMPDGSGFDVLEKLKDLKFDIIFTTATDKFAVKAIKYSALDYLLKPIDSDELVIAVKKIIERNKSAQVGTNEENLRSLLENVRQNESQFSKITLPTGHAYEIVLIKDIIRCEANDNYTNVYLAGGKKFMVSGTLKHYEDLLPAQDFSRVHHSHLINMNHMVRFVKEDGGYAVMSDASKVEVSRRKREDFLNKLCPP
ncbi:MAG: response regulator transcription factor [Bacteroidetes bacterium]|nr:MAG: response regulator transcription factor [Bacteroidota bacterium]